MCRRESDEQSSESDEQSSESVEQSSEQDEWESERDDEEKGQVGKNRRRMLTFFNAGRLQAAESDGIFRL